MSQSHWGWNCAGPDVSVVLGPIWVGNVSWARGCRRLQGPGPRSPLGYVLMMRWAPSGLSH